MAFMAVIMGLGPLFYILLGFRYSYLNPQEYVKIFAFCASFICFGPFVYLLLGFGYSPSAELQVDFQNPSPKTYGSAKNSPLNMTLRVQGPK